DQSMRSSWLKRSNKDLCSLSGLRPTIRRHLFRPFLEILETRTTPAFVTGVPIANLGFYPGGGASEIVTGDFNHDGKLDIAASQLYNGFRLYLGNGNGTFQTPIAVLYPPGQGACFCVAADFNNDGNLDVATCDQNLGYVHISLGNGD